MGDLHAEPWQNVFWHKTETRLFETPQRRKKMYSMQTTASNWEGRLPDFAAPWTNCVGTQQVCELWPQAGLVILHKSSSSRVAPSLSWEPWDTCNRDWGWDMQPPAPEPELNLQKPSLELRPSQIPTFPAQEADKKLKITDSEAMHQGQLPGN